jgi:hypothetical protein
MVEIGRNMLFQYMFRKYPPSTGILGNIQRKEEKNWVGQFLLMPQFFVYGAI